MNAACLPAALHAARLRIVSALSQLPTSEYLRGLTVTRLAFVLVICLMFSVRQQMVACLTEVDCVLDGKVVASLALVVARRFLFALPMVLAVTVADNMTARSATWARVLGLTAAVALGAAVYAPAFLYTQPPAVLQAVARRQSLFILTHFSHAVLYGGLATAVLYLFVREGEDARALNAARLDKVAIDRQTIEAHLQALQAQIEPHFLFNTLANIKLMYETESSGARPLIRDLAAYLRTALPQMREMRSTLARELEFAQAYLRVLRVRMGERLNVVIDVPSDLREATMPPMMLLTLVENAIKHGLGSLPKGGSITIRAERLAERLQVSVIDDGAGFPKGFGGGVGLANTRARLAGLYGDKGHLTLAANPGGGVIAGIELPFAISIAELPAA